MGLLSKIFGGGLPAANVIHVDDSNFKEEVTKSDMPVLLDIWSFNCPHCVRLEPIVARLSREYAGRIKVVEMNGSSDEARKTATRLRVGGTPTVIYFHKGHEQERVVGFRGSLYHKDYIENELLPAVEPPPENTAEEAESAK